MDVCSARDVHEILTWLNQLSYCFTPKHHGGDRSAARWLPELARTEEFEVFDMADRHQLWDEDGNLYGLRIRATEEGRHLLELGTRHEQVARFWVEARAIASARR